MADQKIQMKSGSDNAFPVTQQPTIANNYISSSSFSIWHGSGTLSSFMTYCIVNDVFYFGGVVRIAGFTRSSTNPGMIFTIPEGRSLASGFAVKGGYVTSTGNSPNLRPYEYLNINLPDDANLSKVFISTTESKTNLNNGDVLFSIPYVAVKLQPLS